MLIVLGHTASGKTKLATAIASKINGEIISADSRQVFKGMDVGTGKDLNEYLIGGKHIPYHLIDIKNAGDSYQVNAFKEDFYKAYADITSRKTTPILCGGTGMYINSILQNHELTAVPVNAILREQLLPMPQQELLHKLEEFPKKNWASADLSTKKRLIRAIEIAQFLQSNELPTIKRPAISYLAIGLYHEVETRRAKILQRLNERLDSGLIEEVEGLVNNGVTPQQLIFYGLEYKFVVAYLNKEINLDQLRQKLGIAICQYAKRQMTFFRKMEKDGIKIHWLNANVDLSTLTAHTLNLLEKNQ